MGLGLSVTRFLRAPGERDELCSSDDSVFIGSGVCEGRTRGVKINGDGTASVHSEIIDVASGEHKFVSRTREF